MTMKLIPFDYAVRHLGRSTTRLVLGLGGSVLVVLLVIAAAGFVRGMTQSLAITGGENNVILLGVGSEESIEDSNLRIRAESSTTSTRIFLGSMCVTPASKYFDFALIRMLDQGPAVSGFFLCHFKVNS